jgi:hypothetical protein
MVKNSRKRTPEEQALYNEMEQAVLDVRVAKAKWVKAEAAFYEKTRSRFQETSEGRIRVRAPRSIVEPLAYDLIDAREAHEAATQEHARLKDKYTRLRGSER